MSYVLKDEQLNKYNHQKLIFLVITGLPAKSCRNICKSSLFSPIDNVPHTAPPNDQKSINFSFDFSDESDIDNRLTTEAPLFFYAIL
ncbi:unnamed protein product [Onchocerca flexuosa]|uniref:Uncharacterized protein n=1 Tax=Onchocerca flexuosa TaxID=387005 RepID=A0A3P7UPQ6_9BILA|nr:unnamed protein product [Onchocerca flexuosa]